MRDGASRQRLARIVGAIGVAGLIVLALAYAITREPAPSVKVRWRAGLVALFVCAWGALSYITGRGRRPVTGAIAL